MGINMDIKSKPDFKFINLDGLDESVKNELDAILKSEIASDVLKLPWDNGEKHYNSNATLAVISQQEIQDHWQCYDDSETSYGISETTTSILTPQISGIAYTTCPVMQVQYQDWSIGNAYTNSAATDQSHAYPYVSSVAYTSPMYHPSPVNDVLTTASSLSSSSLLLSSPSNRDNDKRSGRGRNRGKNENYNRITNTTAVTADMQPSYLMQQGQFNQVPAMCHPGVSYIPYVPSQQHPAAGRPIFMPPSHPTQYTSTRIHHNGHHPQPLYPHPPPPNYSQHQLSSPTQSVAAVAMKHHQRQLTQTYNSSIYNNNQDKSSLTLEYLPKNNEKISDNLRSSTATDSFCQISHENDKKNIHNIDDDSHCLTNNDDDSSSMMNYHLKPAGDDVVVVHHVKKEPLNENSTVKSPTETRDAITNGHSGNHHYSKGNKTSSLVIENNKIDDTNMKKLENETIIIEGPLSNFKCTETTDALIATQSSIAIAQNEENIQQTRDASQQVMKSMKPENPNCTSTMPLASKTWASILKSTQLASPCKQQSDSNHFDDHDSFDNVNSIKSMKMMKGENQEKPHTLHQKQQIESVSIDAGMQDLTKIPTSTSFVHKNALPMEQARSKLLNDDPNIYRMGEFLLNYQMDQKTISLLPRGLTNRSNYCYINSILQALLACPPFYNLLRALPRSRHMLKKNSSIPLIDSMIKFVDEFSPLPEGERLPRKDRGHNKRNNETAAIDIKGGNAFEPSYVYTMLKNTSSPGVFSIEGRQEDAEEFLSCLLNGISDEMLELMKKVNEDSQNLKLNEEINFHYDNSAGGSRGGDGVDEEWKVMGPKNKGSITRCTEFERTPLSDIFRGQLRSRILRQGDQTTDNVQPFFTLQLDIEKADSVKTALEILVGKDQVEGMTCSRTKQQIQAWKQVTLEELPVILILHLKWFDYKLDGCSKIFKTVSYAIDLKIDAKFLSPNATKKLTAKQKQYKLFAVTYHDGKETTKGHYVTDAFHVGFGTWVRYDDSSVKGICESDVLGPSPPRVPYLLYYRRCDTIGNNQLNNLKPPR